MADNQITPFQLTDQFTMDNFNQRINETNTALQNKADASSVYTKTESDVLLQKKVNPNLLDNWYFGNAVNQRGATGSITINRYFIDRWLYANGDSASSLTFNDGIVTLNGNNGYCALRQIFETPKSVFIGKRMTISALTTELGLFSYTFTCLNGVENSKIFSDTGSYIVFDTRADNVCFTYVASMETISVIACKVEFGDQQTLAHQENGNWVLNEIPDYGEQLARCQRYFCIIESSYMPAVVAGGNVLMSQTVFLPVTMRATPSLSFAGLSYRFNNDSWVRIDAPTTIYNHSGSFGFDYRNSSFQDGKAGWMYFARCEASADL